MKSSKSSGGFINIILLIIVILVILYYLHIPLSTILSQPWVEQLASIFKGLLIALWQDFLLLVQFVQDVVTGKTFQP